MLENEYCNVIYLIFSIHGTIFIHCSVPGVHTTHILNIWISVVKLSPVAPGIHAGSVTGFYPGDPTVESEGGVRSNRDQQSVL